MLIKMLLGKRKTEVEFKKYITRVACSLFFCAHESRKKEKKLTENLKTAVSQSVSHPWPWLTLLPRLMCLPANEKIVDTDKLVSQRSLAGKPFASLLLPENVIVDTASDLTEGLFSVRNAYGSRGRSPEEDTAVRVWGQLHLHSQGSEQAGLGCSLLADPHYRRLRLGDSIAPRSN